MMISEFGHCFLNSWKSLKNFERCKQNIALEGGINSGGGEGQQ